VLQSSEYAVFVVKKESSIQLFVDGVLVCTTDNLLMALAMYCSAYYVFNLNFSLNIMKTLLFLQKYVFGLAETSSDAHVVRAQRACVALIERIVSNSRKRV